MAAVVLLLFVAALITCIVLEASVLYALAFGLVLFSAYARYCGFSLQDILRMYWQGIRTVGNILIIFVLIGMLTALWRACGTVGGIIVWTLPLIHPAIALVAIFFLNCLMSFLTGTSFGTSATMGVICMTLGTTLGIDPAWTGGAILSGAYFGDRCSPMSSSAALVCTLTHTNIFDNIKLMAKTALVPFVCACIVYAVAGTALTSLLMDAPTGGDLSTISQTPAGFTSSDVVSLFEEVYQLHWVLIIPAALVVILALFRINVKIIMMSSILAAAVICIAFQGMDLPALGSTLLFGYTCPLEEAASMLNGGGIVSMFGVSAIICISSAYAGIFQKTHLLQGLEDAVLKVRNRTSVFTGVFVTSILTVAVTCNQTLSTILTNQVCRNLEPNDTAMMIDLEDSVITISALIPWSIAASVPLATIGAPTISIVFACYLYLLPLWRLTGVSKPRIE